MLSKEEISLIVSKYGPNISNEYYVFKKSPVKMLSHAFLSFAKSEKMSLSVAFINLSKDKSGAEGIIISTKGISYGIGSKIGYIDFLKVKSCEVEFKNPDDINQYHALLHIKTDDDEIFLDGYFAKAPLKHIIDEAHTLAVMNAENCIRNELSTSTKETESNNSDNQLQKIELLEAKDYDRKPTSFIESVLKRNLHFNEVGEKAQRETTEIEKLGNEKKLTVECRVLEKKKPNPAPYGYTESLISAVTISRNDISDIYTHKFAIRTPDSDIYMRSSDTIKNCMKKDDNITEEKIKGFLKDNLSRVTEKFISMARTNKGIIPERTYRSICVLDDAIKNIDRYSVKGEENVSRILLFMLFQMITYTDNVIQSDESKELCIKFFKTFGSLGVILSMLDLEQS